MLFWIIRFSCSVPVKFIRNIASDTASKNRAKRSNRAVTAIREIAASALLEYLNLHTLMRSFMSIAAKDYPLDFFHPVMMGHFCCNGQPLLRVLLWCRLLLLQFKEYSLVSSRFTYRLTSKINHAITRVLKKLQ